MSQNEPKVIYVAEALPGSGKSTKFIEALPLLLHTSKIVYAMPTNALIQELALTIKVKAGLSPMVITSDTVDHVTAHLEKVLAANTLPLIMVTHEALRRADPRLMSGWDLVVDEVPAISDCESHTFDSVSYLGSLANYIEVGDNKRAHIKEGQQALIESIVKSKDTSALSASALDVLKNILSDQCCVEVEKQSEKNKRLVRLVRYRAYLPAFEHANSVHVLANNLKDTLLGVHAASQGWSFERSMFTPEFDGYGKRVELHPFLQGSYSKSKSLMQRNGKSTDAWSNEVQLSEWLNGVTAMIGDKESLAFMHDWVKYNFSPNVTTLPIDCRGINGYQDRSIAICLQHGNVSPDDTLSFPTLSEMLGVSVNDIRKAIQFERFYESTLQAVARTSLRNRDNTHPVTLFVQSMEMANYLKGLLGRLATINTDLMMSPWEKELSEKKKAKAAIQAEVITMFQFEGVDRQTIAEQLDIPYHQVRRWTARLKKAE